MPTQKDDFAALANPLMSPRQHASYTPSDSANIPKRPGAIYVLTAGNLAMRAWNPITGVWANVTYPVTAGQIIPFMPRRILDTGTTATFVLWFWGDETEEA